MRGGGYLDPDDSEPAENADRCGAGLDPARGKGFIREEGREHRLRSEDRRCVGRRSGRERDPGIRKPFCNMPGGRAIQKPAAADAGAGVQIKKKRNI